MYSRITVGSTNHGKIEAVRIAASRLFEREITVLGVEVPSGVSQMPMTTPELKQGAFNRAAAARIHSPNSDLWIGIEGGFSREENEVYCSCWVCALSDEKFSFGQTMAFPVPNFVAEQVYNGLELGEVVERISNGNCLRTKEGLIGVVTKGAVDRIEYNVSGIIAALTPFASPDFYSQSVRKLAVGDDAD